MYGLTEVMFIRSTKTSNGIHELQQTHTGSEQCLHMTTLIVSCSKAGELHKIHLEQTLDIEA
jgi:hypothetical protein